jgi:D-alanine transaminase
MEQFLGVSLTPNGNVRYQLKTPAKRSRGGRTACHDSGPGGADTGRTPRCDDPGSRPGQVPGATPGTRIRYRHRDLPGLRWKRRDIKTVQLLYPSLARMQAKAASKDDAWMVEDGFITEGTSNNAFIVTADGTLVTRQMSTALLHGITRAAVLRHVSETGLKVEERPFRVDEAKAASEAFVTAATSCVTPVVEIDGSPIGSGVPGPITARLREIYIEESRRRAI